MDSKATTTKHQIGKITYLVKSSPSDKATDNLKKKVEKLIIKDLRQSAGKPGVTAFIKN